MAEVLADGGKGTITATLTTTLNNTAKDRFLTVHVAADATPANWTFDDGSKKFADAVAVPANTPYDFGPWFLANGVNLRGGASAAHGDYHIDELQVNL